MTGLFYRRPEAALGIDIGSTSVKLVELSRSAGGYRLEAWAREPLAPQAMTERHIREPSLVAAALARAMARARIRSASAVVAVCGASVVTRTLDMEAGLDDEEMNLQLRAEANRHIPYPIDDVAMDFEVREQGAHEPGRVSVFLAACRREHVDRREAALALAGLRVRAVDIETAAIERFWGLSFPEGGPVEEGLCVALVDLGAGMLRLSVLQAGCIRYGREQPFAEGITVDDREGRAEAITVEVLRALRFFQASSVLPAPGFIGLFGGGASLAGLAASIRQRSGIPTEILDPLRVLRRGERAIVPVRADIAPALALACGLALGGFS
ncbi:type IV pilus assembly protein PilM [Pseudomonas sp. ABC1]|uniref:type IV pilus biogenesis protein PilM n=1 Tax=Pseudomonas sp. ABC1 TaxID=2748080 RepID=UPI0015C38AE0|nr:type IV pilus assembly protein PilM [Pseudomonas sp. ABC1]QLF92898.1 type IV pilus assembly protein PilM [Pseudomonas sp. ABC1]